MASKKEKLELELLATDKAGSVIKDVADATEKLDGETAEVTVTAEDKASAEVRELMTRISGLTDDEKKVILTAEAKKLEAEVRKAVLLLGKVDGEEAEAVLDAKNNAEMKLDAVQAELTNIDNRTVDATVEADDKATSDIRRVDGKLDEIDRRTVDATVDAQEGAGFSSIMGRLDAMPGNLGGAASTVSGMVARGGPLALLAAILGTAATKASDIAIEVDQIATFAGISHEEASRLYAVFQDNGVEATDLLDILGQMSGVLADNPAP